MLGVFVEPNEHERYAAEFPVLGGIQKWELTQLFV